MGAGEKPYRILTTVAGVAGTDLKEVNFFTKMNADGLIDCLLVFDYGDRQTVRKARDFPPDQFVHFFQGVQQRCPLPFKIIDGQTEPELATSMWEAFVGQFAVAVGQ